MDRWCVTSPRGRQWNRVARFLLRTEQARVPTRVRPAVHLLADLFACVRQVATSVVSGAIRVNWIIFVARSWVESGSFTQTRAAQPGFGSFAQPSGVKTRERLLLCCSAALLLSALRSPQDVVLKGIILLRAVVNFAEPILASLLDAEPQGGQPQEQGQGPGEAAPGVPYRPIVDNGNAPSAPPAFNPGAF